MQYRSPNSSLATYLQICLIAAVCSFAHFAQATQTNSLTCVQADSPTGLSSNSKLLIMITKLERLDADHKYPVDYDQHFLLKAQIQGAKMSQTGKAPQENTLPLEWPLNRWADYHNVQPLSIALDPLSKTPNTQAGLDLILIDRYRSPQKPHQEKHAEEHVFVSAQEIKRMILSKNLEKDIPFNNTNKAKVAFSWSCDQ